MLINIKRADLEEFLIDLVRAGCPMHLGCDMLNITMDQGRYIFKKRKTSIKDIKRHRSRKNINKEVLDVAHQMLASGATAGEVALVTGLTVRQICKLDRYGYWVEGLDNVLM